MLLTAIKWADSSPLQTRRRSARNRADFQWTSGGSAGCTFRADSSRPAADSTRVRCGPKNPPRIGCGSATSTQQSGGLFGLEKKPKKSARPSKESGSVRRGLFRFWRTILVDKSLIVRCGFAADFWSARKIHPKNSSNYGLLPCRRSGFQFPYLPILKKCAKGIPQCNLLRSTQPNDRETVIEG